VGVLTPQQMAEWAFLEHLGWRLTTSPDVQRITVQAGHPCARPSLEAALAAGDLTIVFPPICSDDEIRAFAAGLPALADSIPTMGAWNHRLAVANRRAMEKLSAASRADRYIFPRVLIIHSPWWQLSLPQPEWEEVGKAWRARTSPARAIESIYTRPAVAECYVGQMIGLFAAQYELMGPAWFDEAYQPQEIIVGRPQTVENAPFGWNKFEPGYHRRRALFSEGKDQERDPGVVLAELGASAFAARCGIIQNQDNGFSCNENFIIVSVSPRAAELLRTRGGFRYIGERTEQALELHKSAQNLLLPGDEVFAKERRIREILCDPVFSEIFVYIHPYGVITLAALVDAKLRHKTAAIEILLYATGRDYAFYRRYHETFLKRWLRSNGAPAAPSGS